MGSVSKNGEFDSERQQAVVGWRGMIKYVNAAESHGHW